MTPYIMLLAASGVLILLVSWLPMVLRELPLSLPMFCVGFGILFGLLTDETRQPMDHPQLAEHLTELVVIVALTGAGVKLDRPFGFRAWSMTWRLLAIAMPLSILGIALISMGVIGFGPAIALLLAASLAPTDPVLAADVQVGPPRSGEEDDVRFTLTAEAGLNDGLAFPFVNLAVAIALAIAADANGTQWLQDWITIDVVWKLTVGVTVGWLLGRALGWAVFHMPNRAGLSNTGDGFVALGVTFLAYGVAELAHGYGFLAVFIAALGIRGAQRSDDYHQRLYAFADEMERLLMMVILVLFGSAIAGGMLAPLTWAGAAGALLFLFVVRPAAGLVSLIGASAPLAERSAISFFGIRGLGGFYYLAYGLNHAPFDDQELAWAVLGFTVLVSILLHGMTVTPAMGRLDRWRQSRVERPQSVVSVDCRRGAG
ncbi:MAG: cation:proton antiporter [Acetobacteraceae bacterium]